MTVPIFKLSNQIEPFYLQYSSHTDGHNSRYVDTTAILRTCSMFIPYERYRSVIPLGAIYQGQQDHFTRTITLFHLITQERHNTHRRFCSHSYEYKPGASSNTAVHMHEAAAPVMHRPQKISENPIVRTNPRLEAPLPTFFLRMTFRNSAITLASPLI